MKRKIYLFILFDIFLAYLLFVADIGKYEKEEKTVISYFDRSESLDTAVTYSLLSSDWQNITNCIQETASYKQLTPKDEEMHAVHSFARILESKNKYDFILTRDAETEVKNLPVVNKSEQLNELLLEYFILSGL